MQQCMGGNCRRREGCPHYWAPMVPGVPPAERLCLPGEDGMRLVSQDAGQRVIANILGITRAHWIVDPDAD